MSIQHHSNHTHHTVTSEVEVNLMGEVPSIGYVPLHVEDEFLKGIIQTDMDKWAVKPVYHMGNHPMRKPTLWEILNTPIHLLW